MQLAQDLYLVGSGGAGLSHVTDANVYLIDGGASMVLIDAGSGLDSTTIVGNVVADGLDPARIAMILNTHSHWDHARGNASLKEALGCEVGAHEAAIPVLTEGLWTDHLAGRSGYPGQPSSVDLVLSGGETIPVGRHQVEVLATPGHSPDSLCFTAAMDGRTVLFSGDTLSGEGSIGIRSGLDGYAVYRETLEAMLAADPDALMPGHRLFTLAHADVYLRHAIEVLHAKMQDYAPTVTPFYPSWWLTAESERVASTARS